MANELVIKEEVVRDWVSQSSGVKSAITRVTNQIWARASAMSAGFRSGYYMDEERGHVVGGQYARYGHDVRGRVGLVWTDNYAAILDNSKNDTLLKAR